MLVFDVTTLLWSIFGHVIVLIVGRLYVLTDEGQIIPKCI